MRTRRFDGWRILGKLCALNAGIASVGWALDEGYTGLALFLTAVLSIWVWEQL